ncbi:MAG: SRPBCC family protein [bacterium]
MSSTKMITALLISLLAFPLAGSGEIPPPPEDVQAEYGFSELNEDTLQKLLSQGSLMIVRTRDDMSLINVTSGQVVDVPLDVVWSTLIDYESYEEFIPQTEKQVILEQEGNRYLLRQDISVQIWRLPGINVSYKLSQHATPKTGIRFYHVEGKLQGTYGGWDLVPVDDKTMIFYTLFSNLTELGWGIGSLMEAQPDFMTGVNMITAMMVTKAVKKECERRHRQGK